MKAELKTEPLDPINQIAAILSELNELLRLIDKWERRERFGLERGKETALAMKQARIAALRLAAEYCSPVSITIADQ